MQKVGHSFFFQLVESANKHYTVEHCYPKERDKTNTRTNTKRHSPKKQGKYAPNGTHRDSAKDEQWLFHRVESKV